MADELAKLLAEHDDWLVVERGLAVNSLAAYRRDLRRYAAFLRANDATDPSPEVRRVMQARCLPRQDQLKGGAWERMLCCKTASAKLNASGGPVSRHSISSVTRGGGRKTPVA